MKERPILFSAPMVRAILEGRKTQTRRVVKGWPLDWLTVAGFTPKYVANPENHACPYGAPGDRLWVRETWNYAGWSDDGEPWIGYAADVSKRFIDGHLIPEEWGERLTDTWATLSEPSNFDIDKRASDRVWRPSIHMPRWASRITLEVTGVRVERLQEISEADAAAEGVEALDSEAHCEREEFDHALCGNCGGRRLYDHVSLAGVRPDTDCGECDTHVKRYRWLWESINGPESWAENPWVWVIEFKRVTP